MLKLPLDSWFVDIPSRKSEHGNRGFELWRAEKARQYETQPIVRAKPKFLIPRNQHGGNGAKKLMMKGSSPFSIIMR